MSDTIGFLLSDVTRLLRRRFDVRARTIGVTRPQWRVLTTLSRNEGVNQGRLAELVDVEPITLCRMVDRLAEAGLVERRPDPADRRAWRIYLTAAARPILDELRILADGLYAEMGLDDAESEQLRALLSRVHASLAERPDPSERAAANG